ncbi:MAG: IS3 family transposase [Chitinophagaceae bacterium]|nr:MAG: IS3 family transposase [Chitinophagaceae bacterium]
MRQSHPTISLQRLCSLFVVTRQAYYEAQLHENKTSIAHMIVLTLVKELRANMPMLGTRKLLFLLTPELTKHSIKMGRDQLFDLLRFHGLLMRRRRRGVKTTNSHHWLKKYPNLTVDLVSTAAEQLWVSDITYIRTKQGFSYLSLITDAYSRKIMGYALHQTLEAAGCMEALHMAINQRHSTTPAASSLIHHSDRGVQYCCAEYIELLMKENISISMTQNGSPYENALAERINGILKHEFCCDRIYDSHLEAQRSIYRAIEVYNQKWPHGSLDYFTPEQAHEKQGMIRKRWKKYKKPAAKPTDTQEVEV